MEGVVFTTLLQQATPVALIAFLFYIYWQLFKRIEKLESRFDELEKRIEAKFEAIDREYLTREQYYRDWGGFRGELEKISSELHKTTLTLERLIGKMEGKGEK
ncbi:MAG: hypothetical protein QXX12_02745 [Nanopusillaceae archaeon]